MPEENDTKAEKTAGTSNERQRWLQGPTCFIGEAEGDHLVGDAADIPHRGDAAVIRVVLRAQVLQLQDLCLSLCVQERA